MLVASRTAVSSALDCLRMFFNEPRSSKVRRRTLAISRVGARDAPAKSRDFHKASTPPTLVLSRLLPNHVSQMSNHVSLYMQVRVIDGSCRALVRPGEGNIKQVSDCTWTVIDGFTVHESREHWLPVEAAWKVSTRNVSEIEG